MDQIKNLRFAFVLIVLVIEAITDFKKKEVNIVFPALLAAAAAVMLFFTKDISLINAIIGITEGVLLILISFLTKGEIGMGDGILLAACGLIGCLIGLGKFLQGDGTSLNLHTQVTGNLLETHIGN